MRNRLRNVSRFALCIAGLALAGCGSDTATAPRPDVRAMGGAALFNGANPGDPVQIAAIVTVDGAVVTDAAVSVDGVPLTYVVNANPALTGYVGGVPATAGDTLTMVVTAAGQTISRSAIVPGMIEMNPPTGGLTYTDAQDIVVDWAPTSGASMTAVTCATTSAVTTGLWMIAPGTTQCTVPAASTSVPGNRISVMAINGSGDFPASTDLRSWTGKNGFWVTTQDYVDVSVTP